MLDVIDTSAPTADFHPPAGLPEEGKDDEEVVMIGSRNT